MRLLKGQQKPKEYQLTEITKKENLSNRNSKTLVKNDLKVNKKIMNQMG